MNAPYFMYTRSGQQSLSVLHKLLDVLHQCLAGLSIVVRAQRKPRPSIRRQKPRNAELTHSSGMLKPSTRRRCDEGSTKPRGRRNRLVGFRKVLSGRKEMHEDKRRMHANGRKTLDREKRTRGTWKRSPGRRRMRHVLSCSYGYCKTNGVSDKQIM